jgi:uncharacterized protein (TIGR02996 family)
MSQEQALLQAIQDTPAQDGVRFVYADWLEENGRPERAELIRAQCELEHATGLQRRTPLRLRERELLARHGKEWAEPLAPLVEEWEFRRGFIEYVALDADKLLAHGEELFARTPLRELRLLGEGFASSRG